ncbi:MAG: gamma-glutamylcyclotransferase [Bosea sp. (in: a-proteobacteria)]
MSARDDLWVFGYGSLMWNPGFPFEARAMAHLHGYHRSLCVFSHFHRGTPERPGLVMGLDRGGSCHGVAFRVADANREATIGYLREREQVTSIYLERELKLRLASGQLVTCLTYIADRQHRQYAGRLPREKLLEVVAGAVGQSGENPDYVLRTQAQLAALGVHDADLTWLAEQLAPTAKA